DVIRIGSDPLWPRFVVRSRSVSCPKTHYVLLLPTQVLPSPLCVSHPSTSVKPGSPLIRSSPSYAVNSTVT
ncbi:uncharacterized protein FOMMEDRAFT_166686, partial [Fomitiporia mediterranea MF3/22]|uniref:uncharacterized protein n=1 Tax=Fomitiporia mediterranea (strain MF3/22) TaxID=694068 RepID=UPI0004409A2E